MQKVLGCLAILFYSLAVQAGNGPSTGGGGGHFYYDYGGWGGGGMPMPSHPGGGGPNFGGYTPEQARGGVPQQPPAAQPQSSPRGLPMPPAWQALWIESKQAATGTYCSGPNPDAPQKRKNIEFAVAHKATVNQVNTQSSELLPQITPQMEREAADYIRSELQSSEDMVQQAVVLAKEGASKNVVALMSDYAVDKANAANRFLVGVGQGAYNVSATVIDAAQAIYNDPILIAHVSSHIVDMLGEGSTYIMNTVTEGPAAVANATATGIQKIADELWAFEVGMATKTPQEQGQVYGEFGANCVLALAGGEATTGVRKALVGITKDLVNANATKPLGEAVIQGIKASPALAPEMAAIEQKAVREFGTRHGPLNPGRLHEMRADRRIPVSENGSGSIANTFRSSSYSTRTTIAPQRLYRVDTEAVRINPETGLPTVERLPRYYTTVRPEGPLQSTLDSALTSEFNNTSRYWTEIEVPAGQTIHEGFAGEQVLNPEHFLGEALPGGGPQVFIENVPASWYRAGGRVGQ